MIRPSSKSACSKLKLIPFFRDVIRHFELLCRLTMDFRPQTSVIFSPFPVSPVALLFLLPVCDSPFLFPILCCLVLHSPFSVLRSPISRILFISHLIWKIIHPSVAQLNLAFWLKVVTKVKGILDNVSLVSIIKVVE